MFPSLSRCLALSLCLIAPLALAACGAGGGGAGATPAATQPLELDLEERRIVDSSALMDAEIRHFVREMAGMAEDLGFALSEVDPVEDGLDRDAPGYIPDPSGLPADTDGGSGDGLDGVGPPSGFPSGGVGGIDATNPTKTVGEDGTVIVTKVIETPSGARTDIVTYRSDGSMLTEVFHPGGSRDMTSMAADKSSWFRRTSADDQRSFTHFFGPGHVYERTTWRRGRRTAETHLPPRWFNRNPGDEPSWWQKELADWVWSQHRLGRHNPDGPYPLGRDLVNPGDPDYDALPAHGPSIWDYVADLVINPDPVDGAASAARPSEQAAQIMREVLLELARGVTPGGRPEPVSSRSDAFSDAVEPTAAAGGA